MADDRDARVVLTADVSQYQQQMAAAAQTTQQYSQKLDQANQHQRTFFQTAHDGLDKLGKAMLGFSASMVPITATLEKQMSTISGVFASRGTFGEGTEQISIMRDGIKKLSSELPIARGEVAALMTSITKMGITSGEAVVGLTGNFARLAAATGENAQGLAAGQIGLQRQMGTLNRGMYADTQVQNNARMNDSLNNLSAKAGAPAQSILDFSQSIAPSARAAGMSQQQTMGVSTAFVAGGADSGYAASAFTGIMNEIMGMRSVKSPEMAKYAYVLGMSQDQISKMTPFDIAKAVINKVGQSGDAGVAMMNQLGFEGIRTQKAIQGVNAAGGIDKYTAEAMGGTGSVETGAKAAESGLFDELDKLRNKFTDIGDTLGQTLLPVFKTLASVANTIVTPFQALAQVLGPVIALLGVVGIGGAKLATMASVGGTAALMMMATRTAFGQGFAGGRSGMGIDPNGGRMNRAGGWLGSMFRLYGMGSDREPRTGPSRFGEAVRAGINQAGRGIGWFGRWYSSFNDEAREPNAGQRRNVGTTARAPGMAGNFMWGFTRGASGTLGTGVPQTPENKEENKKFNEARRADEAKARADARASGSTARVLSTNLGIASTALKNMTVSSIKATASLAALATGAAIGGTGRLLGSMVGGIKNALSPIMGMLGPMLLIGGATKIYSAISDTLKSNSSTMSTFAAGKGEVVKEESYSLQTKYNAALGMSTNALGKFSASLDNANPAKDQSSVANSINDPNVKTAGNAKKDYTDSRVGDIKSSAQAKDFIAGQPKMDPNTAVLLFQDLYKNPNLTDEEVDQLKREYLSKSGNGSGAYIPGKYQMSNSDSLGARQYAQGASGPSQMIGNRPGGLMASALSWIGNASQMVTGNQSGWATDQQSALLLKDEGFQKQVGIEYAPIHQQAWERAQTADRSTIPKSNKTKKEISANDYGKLNEIDTMSKRLSEHLMRYQDAVKSGDHDGAVAEKANVMALISMAQQNGISFDQNAIMEYLSAVPVEGVTQKSVRNVVWNSTLSANQLTGTAQEYGLTTPEKLESVNAKVQPAKIRENVRIALDTAKIGGELRKVIAENPQLQAVLEGTDQTPLSQTMATETLKGKGTYAELMRLAQIMPQSKDFIIQQAQALHAKQQEFMPTLSLSGQQNLQMNQIQDKIDAYKQDPSKNNAPLLTEAKSQARQGLIQLISSMQDFAHSRQREQEAWNKTMADTEFDFHQQLLYGQEDYQRQVKISEESFYRDRQHSIDEFNIQKQRSQEDYNLQEKRMFEDAANNIYSVYQRIYSTQTAGGETIADNMKQQIEKLNQQRANLDALKKKGLTQDAINQLGLTDPKNAQQLQRLVGDIANDPKIIESINAAAAARAAATKKLLDNEDNTALKRQRDDYKKQVDRSNADMQRSMAWSLSQFNIQIGLGLEAYNIGLARSLAGYEKSMSRAIRDRNIQLQYTLDDFMSNWKLQMADEQTLMEEGYRIAGEYFGNYSGQMISWITRYRNLLNDVQTQIDRIGKSTSQIGNMANSILATAASVANLHIAPQGTFKAPQAKGTGNAYPSNVGGSYGNPTGGPSGHYNDGGLIKGPGTKTSDSIPVMLSNGEFVIKADSVDKYGVTALEAINKGQVKKYSSGSQGFSTGSYVGSSMVRVGDIIMTRSEYDQRRGATHTNSDIRGINTAGKGITPSYAKQTFNTYNNTNFNGEITVKASDPQEMTRQLQREARLKQMRGLTPAGK